MSDTVHEQILDLRPFGVQARVTTSSSATGGEYVEMDCTAVPGAGTIIHYHPEQEETFRVLEGRLDVLSDGHWRAVQPGETYATPPGAIHAWRNAGQSPLRFLNVHRPALGFQDHMETLDRLVRSGKVRGMRDLRSLIYMSMSAVKHRPDVGVKPPQWLVETLAFIGRRLGYTLD
jgi:mannose-6-phosphate isomerase-like protein (cupin superfamily)